MGRREHLKELNDESPMPFGEHKGVRMRDVPPDYLLRLYRQEWIRGWKGVYNYIKKNYKVLLSEVDDEATEEERDFSRFEDFRDYSR